MATLTLRIDSLARKVDGKSREEGMRESQCHATSYEMPTLQDYNHHTRAERFEKEAERQGTRESHYPATSYEMPTPQDYTSQEKSASKCPSLKITTKQEKNTQVCSIEQLMKNRSTKTTGSRMKMTPKATTCLHSLTFSKTKNEKRNKQDYRKPHVNDTQNNYLPHSLTFPKTKNASNLQTKTPKANATGSKQTSNVPIQSNPKRRPRVYSNNNTQPNKVKTARQNRATKGGSHQNANGSRTFWNSNVGSQHAEANITDYNINSTPKTGMENTDYNINSTPKTGMENIEHTKFVYDLIQLDCHKTPVDWVCVKCHDEMNLCT